MWFTSDHHFGHGNIVEYQKRPFTAEEQDSELVRRWNDTVANGDTVYHLGDFSLADNAEYVADLFAQLKGRIHLIANYFHHDRRWLAKVSPKRAFGQCAIRTGQGTPLVLEPPICVLATALAPIVLCHYPIRTWDRKHYGSWHLYGHVHKEPDYLTDDSPPTFSLNVGVDVWNYQPVPLSRIHEEMIAHGWYEGWKEFE
jgi:calcineurin-like phosphoesterase family protein